MEQCRRPLYGFIINMIGAREEADEVFQETWYRAIRNLNRYKEKRFLSWLFKVAHNLVIDRARRRQTADRHAQNMAERTGPEIPTEAVAGVPPPSPAAAAAGRDLGRRLTAAIAQLPDEQREVFLLRTEADLPFREIASLQGVSINTALARMQYALSKLRNMLKEEYEAWQRT